MMDAHVRTAQGRFFLVDGLPSKDNIRVIGEFATRRQTIREGKKMGYDIYIKGRENTITPTVTQTTRIPGYIGYRKDIAMNTTNAAAVSEPTQTYNETKTEQPKVDEFDEKAYHKETLKMLENSIKNTFKEGNYKEFLDTVSKFNGYSYGNCALIAMQNPGATYLAGEKFYNDTLNRKLYSDAEKIRIIAPSTFTTMQDVESTGKDGKKHTERVEVTIPRYITVHVYDVADTDGVPMPEHNRTHQNNEIKLNDIFTGLETVSPAPIFFESIKSATINSYYDHFEKTIFIQDGLSSEAELKEAIKEIAHTRIYELDNNSEDRNRDQFNKDSEIEATSIAYIVSRYYGVDTSDYNFDQITQWSKDKDLKELKDSLSTIRKEASTIISGVDKKVKELENVRNTQEKNTIVTVIMNEIKKQDPEFPQKGLQDIEKNLRQKSLRELKERDYPFFMSKDFTDRVQEVKQQREQQNPTKTNEIQQKPTQKTNTPQKKAPLKEKTGVRANMAAAKKEAAQRKPTTKKKAVSMDLG